MPRGFQQKNSANCTRSLPFPRIAAKHCSCMTCCFPAPIVQLDVILKRLRMQGFIVLDLDSGKMKKIYDQLRVWVEEV